jgi:heme-degrading monooxygenase HmoA
VRIIVAVPYRSGRICRCKPYPGVEAASTRIGFWRSTEGRGRSMKIGQPFTSGTWVVMKGKEDEFIARWTEFVGWTHENAAGAEAFLLIRNTEEPHRFISFASWESDEAVDAWRARPEFQELLGRCRELCEDFRGIDHVLAAAVGG